MCIKFKYSFRLTSKMKCVTTYFTGLFCLFIVIYTVHILQLAKITVKIVKYYYNLK